MRIISRIEQLEQRFGQPLEQVVAVCVNSAGNVIESLSWIGARSIVHRYDVPQPRAAFPSCKEYHGITFSMWNE